MAMQTLEQAHNTIFHTRQKFPDFCSLDMSDDVVKKREVNGVLICAPSPQLKNNLKFLNKVIFRNLAFDSNVVHAFVKGRSVYTALESHAAGKYFFLTDIRNFYSCITKNDVKKVLERDKRIIPISDFENYIDKIVDITTFEEGLPIGFPTSPLLSNAFLYEFDKTLSDYASRLELTYTRYADDIIISSGKLTELLGLKDQIQRFLCDNASPKLVLNNSKTRIIHQGNKVKILGLVILPNGKITIDRKYKNLIECLLHYYVRDKSKFDDLLKSRLSGNFGKLFGLLHYSNSIDPVYMLRLQRKYGLYAVKSLMENDRID